MGRSSVRAGVVILGVTILALVGLALLVAGCGSSTSTSSTSPTAAASSATPSALPTWTAADLAAVTTDSSLTALLPAKNQASGVLKLVSDIPYPPWEFFNPATSTNPAGYDFDLSQALGKKLGVKVDFADVPFNSILLRIKDGTADLSMSSLYDNAERQKAGYSFVDYSSDGTGILVAKGNPNGITDVNSLAGKTVTVESGATQQAVLADLNKAFAAAGQPQMTIQAVQKQPEALLKVSSGVAVADLTDFSTAAYIHLKTPGKFDVVGTPFLPQLDGICVLATNTQLLDALQKALQALMDEGVYQKITAAWAFVPLPSATINQGPAYAAAHASPAPSSSP
jgi:polar amino acid transport system substrate-binding protein